MPVAPEAPIVFPTEPLRGAVVPMMRREQMRALSAPSAATPRLVLELRDATLTVSTPDRTFRMGLRAISGQSPDACAVEIDAARLFALLTTPAASASDAVISFQPRDPTLAPTLRVGQGASDEEVLLATILRTVGRHASPPPLPLAVAWSARAALRTPSGRDADAALVATIDAIRTQAGNRAYALWTAALPAWAHAWEQHLRSVHEPQEILALDTWVARTLDTHSYTPDRDDVTLGSLTWLARATATGTIQVPMAARTRPVLAAVLRLVGRPLTREILPTEMQHAQVATADPALAALAQSLTANQRRVLAEACFEAWPVLGGAHATYVDALAAGKVREINASFATSLHSIPRVVLESALRVLDPTRAATPNEALSDDERAEVMAVDRMWSADAVPMLQQLQGQLLGAIDRRDAKAARGYFVQAEAGRRAAQRDSRPDDVRTYAAGPQDTRESPEVNVPWTIAVAPAALLSEASADGERVHLSDTLYLPSAAMALTARALDARVVIITGLPGSLLHTDHLTALADHAEDTSPPVARAPPTCGGLPGSGTRRRRRGRAPRPCAREHHPSPIESGDRTRLRNLALAGAVLVIRRIAGSPRPPRGVASSARPHVHGGDRPAVGGP